MTSPSLRQALALTAAATFALGCQPHNEQISTAPGVPTRPTMASGGLGNVGGGNDPDGGHVDPDSGVMPFPDVPTSDGTPLQEGSCAAESHAAQQAALDLLLLVDRSGSMADPVPSGKSKWELAQEALTAFVGDPQSAGLAVGLQYFPLEVPCNSESDCGFVASPLVAPACLEERACVGAAGLTGLPRLCGARREGPCPTGTSCVAFGRCSDTGIPCLNIGSNCPGAVGSVCTATARTCQDMPLAMCQPSDYASLAVPIGDLPGTAKALTLSLARTIPNGGTPTDPAVAAALNQLQMRAAAHPDHRQVLVLVTDGLPNSCDDNPVALISNLVGAAQMGTPSIPTYAIGVFGPEDMMTGQDALDRWASAGGTGTPFVLSAGDDLSQKLVDALNQIRRSALPCEYAIPMPMSGALDYMRVNVHLGGPTGSDLPYVGAAANCDPTKGGWYYDVDPAMGTPTHVVMCQSTCDAFKTSAMGSIELRYGCKTVVIQ